MKKLIVLSFLILITLNIFPQGNGWNPIYVKTDFRAYTNFAKEWRINGTAVTSTALELSKLHGSTFTGTVLNYITGVTGPIQTQLNLLSPITNPTFIGLIKLNTDTIATRAYARANGSGGDGGSKGGVAFEDITGIPANNTALQSAFDLKSNITSPIFGGAYAKIGSDTLSTRAYTRTKVGSATDTTHLSNRINLKANLANPNFTGTIRLATNDTIATRAYSRLHGSGGGGSGGVWGYVTGTLSSQTDLQNALNAKLSTSGSAANLTSFPTLNQNTSGYASSVKSPTTSGVITVTGMTAGTTRIKTVRDANDTFLELGGTYTPTGTWVWTSASVTWPTFNQNTTGSAATLTTGRTIYGSASWTGSGNISSIISSVYGGTGNGFFKVSGPTTSEKTYTLPDATSTILTSNSAVTVAQGGTGRATGTTAYALKAVGTTATGVEQSLATGTTNQTLLSGGSAALPSWTPYTLPTTNGTNTYVLTTNGSGTTSWTAQSGGAAFSTITGNWYDNTSLNTELIDSINDIDIPIVYNSQSGSNYNIALTDKNKVIEMTSSSANTFTILQNSSIAFPLNIPVMVTMNGSGQTTITAGSGVTLHSHGGYLKIGARYGYVTCIQRSTNTWDVIGDLAP